MHQWEVCPLNIRNTLYNKTHSSYKSCLTDEEASFTTGTVLVRSTHPRYLLSAPTPPYSSCQRSSPGHMTGTPIHNQPSETGGRGDSRHESTIGNRTTSGENSHLATETTTCLQHKQDREFKYAYGEALLKRLPTPHTVSTTPMPTSSIPLIALSPKRNIMSSFKQAYDQVRMRKFELPRERAQSARPTPEFVPVFVSVSPMKVPSLLTLATTKPSCLVEGLAL